MKLSKSKTIKCIRFRAVVFTMAFLFISLLVLLIDNDERRALLFVPIGALVLIVVYFKVKACLKILETKS